MSLPTEASAPNGIVTVRRTSKGHIGSEISAGLAHSGDFNHEMIIDEGMVYEAVPWHGARLVIQPVAMRGVARYQDIYVPVPDIVAMRTFGLAQLGKGYDWPGAIGLPVRRAEDWQDSNRWWCRELVFAMLDAGGAWSLDPAERLRVSANGIGQSDFTKSQITNVLARKELK
jgi:hypothetical protein